MRGFTSMSRSALVSLAAAALLMACDGAAGDGSGGVGNTDSCPETCLRVVELCPASEGGPTQEECERECEQNVAGKTGESIAATARCVDSASSCAATMECRDLLVDAPAAGGSSGGGGTTTQRSEAAAGAMCDKMVECGMPSSERAACVNGVSSSFEYLIDSASFSSCIQAKSCTALTTQPEETVNDCLNIDWDSFACSGDTLHYCSNTGECLDLDCRDVCQDTHNTTDVSCGMDSESGHEKCKCYL